MRDYAKVGSKPGKPGYRTSSMFANKVLSVVSKIPKGRVLTYKEVAKMAGSPGASRAVGSIMARNYDPQVFCHRVVRSDGFVGGYRCGTKKKIAILKKEGVEISKGKVIK